MLFKILTRAQVPSWAHVRVGSLAFETVSKEHGVGFSTPLALAWLGGVGPSRSARPLFGSPVRKAPPFPAAKGG